MGRRRLWGDVECSFYVSTTACKNDFYIFIIFFIKISIKFFHDCMSMLPNFFFWLSLRCLSTSGNKNNIHSIVQISSFFRMEAELILLWVKVTTNNWTRWRRIIVIKLIFLLMVHFINDQPYFLSQKLSYALIIKASYGHLNLVLFNIKHGRISRVMITIWNIFNICLLIELLLPKSMPLLLVSSQINIV